MRVLSAIISIFFVFGIKSSMALFECHPHKVICDKNCELRHGSMIFLTKMCKMACSISQCLVKNKSASALTMNRMVDNPSLRQGNAIIDTVNTTNVKLPTPSTTVNTTPATTGVAKI